MTKGKQVLVSVAVLALAGCQTVFTGAAKVQNGPRGCWDQCQAWGMDLAGMVKMGEYSDGCICQVRPAPPQQHQSPQPQPPGAPRSQVPLDVEGPAVAGVWMQMQAAAAEHQRQQQASMGQPGWRGSSGPGGLHR